MNKLDKALRNPKQAKILTDAAKYGECAMDGSVEVLKDGRCKLCGHTRASAIKAAKKYGDKPEHRSTENGCEEGCEACTPEPKHTPTPWQDDNDDLRGPNGEVIASFTDDGGIAFPLATKGNRKFIVRAVNSHEALLEACKGLVRSISMNCQERGPLPGAVKINIQKANDAISQAEGE